MKEVIGTFFLVISILLSSQVIAEDDPPTAEQFKDIKKRINKFIAETNKVKRADADLLEDLINKICGSDIERNNDKAERAADRIKDHAQRKLKPSVNYIIVRQQDLMIELKRFLTSGSPFRSTGGKYMGKLRDNGKVIEKMGMRILGLITIK